MTNLFSGIWVAWYNHKKGLREFLTVMQTRDEVEGLLNYLVFISGYVNTENVFYCLNVK